MKLIAISGKKQSGKTTAVEDIYSRLSPMDKVHIELVSFADRLKELVVYYFGKPVDYRMVTSDIEKLKTEKHPCGKTYRELLQIVGTDWCRAVWPEIWIENFKYQIDTECYRHTTVLVPDVRFPNEVACVQQLGGHVIRLLRNPHDDKHESETALDSHKLRDGGIYIKGKSPDSYMEQYQRMRTSPGFDAIIDNREMSITEQNEAVWNLIQERKWL